MAFYSAALVTAAALTIYSCGSVAMTVEQKWLAQTGGGMEAEEQGLFPRRIRYLIRLWEALRGWMKDFYFRFQQIRLFRKSWISISRAVWNTETVFRRVCIIWKRRTGIGCLERPISFQQIRLVRN